jgi:hypothetical protein
MGFKGLLYNRRRGASFKPVINFRGIALTLDVNLPIKIVDQRGRGIRNATVTISNPNTSDPRTTITDSNGNCVIKADNSNPNPVTVVKDKVVTQVNYTTGAALTVVMDMMKNKPQIL